MSKNRQSTPDTRNVQPIYLIRNGNNDGLLSISDILNEDRLVAWSDGMTSLWDKLPAETPRYNEGGTPLDITIIINQVGILTQSAMKFALKIVKLIFSSYENVTVHYKYE